ncbi:MAG: ABC transporter permease [Streptosporangiales bacterium]|nr:ABC transporter permease [Streptosporangiales bacterium]
MILVPLLVTLAVTAFTWPNARLEPRDLPIGVVGQPPATAQLTERLASQSGAFEVHLYRSTDAARDAIEERDIYGAIVVSEAGAPTVLTASAASPMVASMLTQSVTESVPPQLRAQVRTVDVVPTAEGDPRGTLLGIAVFPLMLAGLATGALAFYLTRSLRDRLLGMLVSSAVSGVAVVAVVQWWLEGLDGDWVANAGVLALVTFAIATAVAGLATVAGRAGIGIAGLLFVLLGNPASGMASPEMLPQWFAWLGQLLPLGTGGNLLRSVAFFDGNAMGGPLAVLIVWAAIGSILLTVPTLAKLAKRAQNPSVVENNSQLSAA